MLYNSLLNTRLNIARTVLKPIKNALRPVKSFCIKNFFIKKEYENPVLLGFLFKYFMYERI